MQIVLAILSLALLGVIIYFLVSPKSSHLLKLSCIIALALIGLSLGVCGVIILAGHAEEEEVLPITFLPQNEIPPKEKSNWGMIVTFLVAFLIITSLVIYSYLKEKEKHDLIVKTKKVEAPPVFVVHEELDVSQKTEDDGSFNIEL